MKKITIRQEDLHQLITHEKKNERFTRTCDARKSIPDIYMQIVMRDLFGYTAIFDHPKLILKLKEYFAKKHPYLDISKVRWKEHMDFIEEFPEGRCYCFAIGATCPDYTLPNMIFKDYENKSCDICKNSKSSTQYSCDSYCIKSHYVLTNLYDKEILAIRELCKL